MRNKHDNQSYLLGKNGSNIYKVVDQNEEQEGSKGCALSLVFEHTSKESSEEHHYNASISFPSNDRAIFSDGQGELCIIDTAKAWNVIHKEEKCGNLKPFRVASSLFSTDKKCLSVLIHGIEEKAKVNNLHEAIKAKASNFVNIVEWFEFNASTFKLERCRSYAFLGEIESLELCHSGILYFGEDKSFQLLNDSAGMDETEVEKMEEPQQTPKEPAPSFYWMQGVEDMVIWVMLPDNINKKEIKVVLKPSQMSIKIRDTTILDGKLWNVIDSDSMSWTIDSKKKRLEVNMSKANVGMIWQRFIADKALPDGEEVNSPEMVERLHEEFSQLTTTTEDPNANCINENSQIYNAQELDACDDQSDISRVFLCIKTPKEVQKVNVGEKQVLIGQLLASSDTPSQICVRHDVDGLVWQPLIKQEGRLTFEHVDTFDALGYVQASKSQRRFTVSAPDRSYSAIIDRARHVYIYRKPEPISEGCELRNRKSGQNVQKVAKQQVPTLEHDPDDFVTGALALEKSLYVATTRNLYCLKIH